MTRSVRARARGQCRARTGRGQRLGSDTPSQPGAAGEAPRAAGRVALADDAAGLGAVTLAVTLAVPARAALLAPGVLGQDPLITSGFYLAIDPDSGKISAVASNIPGLTLTNAPPATQPGQEPNELVCFIGIGKMPKWCQSEYELDMAPFAEIYSGDKYLGRSYPFANTSGLMADSRKRLAVLQAGKDTTRVVVKEVIAQSVESQNQALGDITRLILFAMEEPDTRCWETLPLWLEVARVPCPSALKNYKVVFKTSSGVALKTSVVSAPIARRGNIFVSFCRDLEGE